MPTEYCYAGVCFVPLDPNSPRLFGFPELLAGLALMVLAWTIADVRYRFRIWTAPLPLRDITFIVVAIVGVLTLLTDLWRAEQWLVPRGHLISPAMWQAMLAALFLLTFLTWAWFAFHRPARFGRWNARRYVESVGQFILRGASDELPVIASELKYSARALVDNAEAVNDIETPRSD